MPLGRTLVNGSLKGSICRVYIPDIDFEGTTESRKLPCCFCGVTSDKHLHLDPGADAQEDRREKTPDPAPEPEEEDYPEAHDDEPLSARAFPVVSAEAGEGFSSPIEPMSFGSVQIPARFVGNKFSITRKDPYSIAFALISRPYSEGLLIKSKNTLKIKEMQKLSPKLQNVYLLEYEYHENIQLQNIQKYMRFDGLHYQNKLNDVKELMLKWDFTPPTFILSVTGGSLAEVDDNSRESIAETVKSISNSTDLWILSDGRNDGTSRFLGRLFHSASNTSKIPVLVSITDWRSIHRKELLMGKSTHSSEKKSRYFYDIEYRLTRKEDRSILNPYQQIYLLLDNRDDTANVVREFRTKFQSYVESYAPSEIFLMTGAKIPLITLVIGGDEHTLGQVVDSVKSNNFVIVVNGSGHIPSLISDLYFHLEDALLSTQTERNRWSDTERQVFTEYMKEYCTRVRKAFNCLHHKKDDQQMKEKKDEKFVEIMKQLREVMKNRFYIMITETSGSDVSDNFYSTILRAVYKGGTRIRGLCVALKAESADFLQCLFSKDMETPREEDKDYIDLDILASLHLNNFSKGSLTAKILRLINERDHLKDITDPFLVMQSVGRILHLLLGQKYRLLYHEPPYAVNVDGKPVPIIKKRGQIWDLFLWSILGGKPSLTHFFLLRGSGQLSCALIAVKLYSGIAEYASELYQVELKDYFTEASRHFERVAIDILDEMYNISEEEAYRTLTSEMPFKLGPQVTPLMVADDAEAMQFMQHVCCQTYLQSVWKGNMVMETPAWMSMAVCAPLLVIPLTNFKSEGDEIREPEPVEYYLTCELPPDNGHLPDPAPGDQSSCCVRGNDKSFWWKLKSYYTAPITKFYTRMFSYLTLLVLISYFILVDLKPIKELNDITVVEWLVMFWLIAITADEAYQIVVIRHAGPLHRLPANTLSLKIWDRFEILKMKCHVLVIHMNSGVWNTIDFCMITLYIIAFSFRFTLPNTHFQLVRIVFSVALIISYFRLLRFWYILEAIGPRIIAITMMLTELTKFLLLLAVFIVSFGIAFQAILEPGHEPSMQLLVDIVWRPYWQMFVNNATCGILEDGQVSECYLWVAPVLLAVYLLISNVLLLNLLIAIFSQAYDKIEEEAQTVWMYNLYSLTEEFYYLSWLPPPLGIFHYTWASLVWCFKYRSRPRDTFRVDKFRTEALPTDHDLQRKACKGIKPFIYKEEF